MTEPQLETYGYEEPPRQPMTKQSSNSSLNGGFGGSSYGGHMSRSNSENFLNDTPRSNTSQNRGLEDTFSESESDVERGMCFSQH